MEPLSRVFDIMQYFETILPSVESLWSSLQDKLYLMGGGAAEASDVTNNGRHLPRHLGFYQEYRNQVKTVRINNFLRLTCKITHK